MRRFWKKHCLEVPVYTLLLIGAMYALSFAAADDLAEARRAKAMPTVAEAAVQQEIPEEKPEEETELPIIEEDKPELVSLGEYRVTYYCRENYPHICNNGDATSTATGTVPTPGRTIAVDPKVIPYGTEVVINGHTYIAEDCGGAVDGNEVDILVETHEEALQCGVDHYEVFLIEEPASK